MLHLAQQQDGYVTNEAMVHIGELVGATAAEVLGTATFYEMFKFEPVGKYLINICSTMSCALLGADELMHHAEHKLGIKAGGTTPDGLITLAHAECQAACTEAPTLQVNYRYRFRVTNEMFDQLVDDLRAGRLDGEIPPHGTLARGAPEHPRRSGRRRGAARRRHRGAGVAGHRTPQADRRSADVSDDRHHLSVDAGVLRRRPPAGSSPRASSTRTRYTLERYEATGGYQGLRNALGMARAPTCTRWSRTPPSSAAAAPASRPA